MVSRPSDEHFGEVPHRSIGPICLCAINVNCFVQISSQQYSVPRFLKFVTGPALRKKPAIY